MTLSTSNILVSIGNANVFNLEFIIKSFFKVRTFSMSS
jgi:hypothetical protein